MQSHFFAYMARMKHIKRWGLRRNTIQENDQEHSHLVSMIAHAICVIHNTRYGGQVDPGMVTMLAVYHEAPEVITGDLATPIKYFNPGIKDAFKEIEHLASEKLFDYLPDDLKESFKPLLFPDENTIEWKIVKAADRISAYVKCIEELSFGNNEFASAQESIRISIYDMNLPAAEDFMKEFTPSFRLALDALN